MIAVEPVKIEYERKRPPKEMRHWLADERVEGRVNMNLQTYWAAERSEGREGAQAPSFSFFKLVQNMLTSSSL